MPVVMVTLKKERGKECTSHCNLLLPLNLNMEDNQEELATFQDAETNSVLQIVVMEQMPVSHEMGQK